MTTSANASTPTPRRFPIFLPPPLRVFLATVALVGAAVAILAIVAILFRPIEIPFGFGEGKLELTELSGKEAIQRLAREGLDLARDWPAGIDPAELRNVSLKCSSTIDSYSTWYRIGLSPTVASTWRDDIHLKEERRYEGSFSRLYEGIEGVHRVVSGPPPMHYQTGTTPAWWSPPAIDFRATELMKWYRDFNSGVGAATYSGYDESSNTLWVYEYSCQHDRLWPPGIVPAGQQFATIKRGDVGQGLPD